MYGNSDEFMEELLKENQFATVPVPTENEPKDIAKIVEEAARKAFQDAQNTEPIKVEKVEPTIEKEVEPNDVKINVEKIESEDN